MDDRTNRYGQRDEMRGGFDQDYGQDFGSGRNYSYSSARDYAAAGAFDRDDGWRGRGGRGRDDWSNEGRERGSYRQGGQGYGRGGYGGGYGGYGGRDQDEFGGYGPGSYGAGGYGQGGYGQGGYGQGGYGQGQGGAAGYGGYGAQYRGGWRDDVPNRERSRDWGQDAAHRRNDPRDRGFFERAGDEVRSWFGDEDAERRRLMDQRYDETRSRSEGHGDNHYHSWRRQRIAELDRDYDEYRQENSQRFENEFNNWRTDRQGQRESLRKVEEHMDVVGADGSHVGTVDKVRGDRIILTKSDAESGGHHHSIPSRWIQSVDDKVTLRKTAEEAKAHWRDEERAGALFGEDGERATTGDRNSGERTSDRDRQQGEWSTGGNLNRSFSGTY